MFLSKKIVHRLGKREPLRGERLGRWEEPGKDLLTMVSHLRSDGSANNPHQRKGGHAPSVSMPSLYLLSTGLASRLDPHTRKEDHEKTRITSWLDLQRASTRLP